MSQQKQFSIEQVMNEEINEYKKLCRLTIISLLDPEPQVRLAAIKGLHQRYTPQVRKSYVLDQLVVIETRNPDGEEPIPYLICELPTFYLGKVAEVLSWDMDQN